MDAGQSHCRYRSPSTHAPTASLPLDQDLAVSSAAGAPHSASVEQSSRSQIELMLLHGVAVHPHSYPRYEVLLLLRRASRTAERGTAMRLSLPHPSAALRSTGTSCRVRDHGRYPVPEQLAPVYTPDPLPAGSDRRRPHRTLRPPRIHRDLTRRRGEMHRDPDSHHLDYGEGEIETLLESHRVTDEGSNLICPCRVHRHSTGAGCHHCRPVSSRCPSPSAGSRTAAHFDDAFERYRRQWRRDRG